MRSLVAALVSVVLALGVAGCQTSPTRIVDCAPGFHNVAGPDSDCVPNTPAPGTAPATTTAPPS